MHTVLEVFRFYSREIDLFVNDVPAISRMLQIMCFTDNSKGTCVLVSIS
uniref:Uncharacterized protein n=1 Tax=Anguilla anguilla TaxID=7936 RepID=A0A0E9SY78_ANGAN